MNERIKEIYQKIKNPKFLIIAGLFGIVLIFISSFGTGEKSEKMENVKEFSAEEYRVSLQKEIKNMVTDITGDRDVTVVITLESGINYAYADTREETAAAKSELDNESSDKKIKEGYITIKTADGGEEALLITEKMPEIRGVAIVCEGGDNELLNEKIKNTVTAALNITSKRVYICGRKK